MECRSFLLVAATLVAAVVVVSPQATDSVRTIDKLCGPKACDCKAEEIVCACSNNEKIEVKKDDMAGQTAVTKFEIENCSSLLLTEDSFTNAHKLKTLIVRNVDEVDLKGQKDAFPDLKTVWIDKVKSLHLNKGVFVGMKNINLDSLRIQESTIQELHEGALDLKVKSLEFNSLTIQKIAKSAIKIEGGNENSTVNISKSKIDNIGNLGIEISKFTNFTLENCEFNEAAKNSIILRDLVTFVVEGNKFQHNVDVESLEVSSSKNVIFVNNELLNIDTTKEIKSKTKEDETSLSFENIIINHDGNAVNCKCGTGLKLSGKLGNNVCVSGTCKNVTLENFMKSCQTFAGKHDDEILNSFCPQIQGESDDGDALVTPALVTTPNSGQTPKPTTTQTEIPQHDVARDAKAQSHGSKITLQFFPLVVIYLCTLIL